MVAKRNRISLESLIKQVNDQFGHVAEIYVAHLPVASDVSQLFITVHAGEADSMEQYLDLTTADEVTIDVGEADPLSLPFDVMATVNGAGHIQRSEGTTVYMADNVMGAESRELEAGLAILRQKLAGVCPSCETEVDTLHNHYTDSRECRKKERTSVNR